MKAALNARHNWRDYGRVLLCDKNVSSRRNIVSWNATYLSPALANGVTAPLCYDAGLRGARFHTEAFSRTENWWTEKYCCLTFSRYTSVKWSWSVLWSTDLILIGKRKESEIQGGIFQKTY